LKAVIDIIESMMSLTGTVSLQLQMDFTRRCVADGEPCYQTKIDVVNTLSVCSSKCITEKNKKLSCRKETVRLLRGSVLAK